MNGGDGRDQPAGEAFCLIGKQPLCRLGKCHRLQGN
jgi:hypothetical protein